MDSANVKKTRGWGGVQSRKDNMGSGSTGQWTVINNYQEQEGEIYFLINLEPL